MCIRDSDDTVLLLEERNETFFKISAQVPIMNLLSSIGSTPLPPYIKRSANQDDQERYQTIFASKKGAVAAPTAGLHFTQEILNEIKQLGADIGELTLHVGAGTFAPIRSEQIKSKKLHKEFFEIDERLCEQIKNAKANGGRVIAVGTTVVRALESIMLDGKLQAVSGETDIFITPGFDFKLVDAMVTNFHLPESSLIMLVSAFAGKEIILKSYQHAINKNYRFYSYGDSMFIERGLCQ